MIKDCPPDSESGENVSEETGVVIKRKGKFSLRESELIVKTVKEFVSR